MADLDLLSYSEPSHISSRQFLTQAYSVFPPEGIDYFFSPSTSTRLEISGMSQNIFVLPQTLRLCYSAISNVQTLAQATPPPGDINLAVQVFGPVDTDQVPSMPAFGAPHISSVQVDVPGLSTDLGLLGSDGQSQRFYSARLLCSGSAAVLEVPGEKTSYKATDARAHSAGAMSSIERANQVSGSFYGRTVGGAGTPEVGRVMLTGGFERYEVPASAWFAMANCSSSALPLAYLTASSSNLVARVNWAPAASALNVGTATAAWSLAQYWVTGVSLEYTGINILSPAILGTLEKLYRGQSSIPVSAGVSVPVPMVQQYTMYRYQQATLMGNSGSISMRVPAGVAQAMSLMVRIEGNGYSASQSAGQDGAKYLLSPACVLTEMLVRIGSSQFNARPYSDVVVPQGLAPRGISTSKFLLNTVSAADAVNNFIGGPVVCEVSHNRNAEAYRQCREDYSFWPSDCKSSAPAAILMDPVKGASCMSGTLNYMTVTTADRQLGVHADGVSAGYPRDLEATRAILSPNLFFIPLRSMVSEHSPLERGFQTGSIDLRNAADIQLDIGIGGVMPSGVNQISNTSGAAGLSGSVASWSITAWLAYSELAVLLPSRVDLKASSSLVPSAAGVVSSGSGV